jgi:hypothetical protein
MTWYKKNMKLASKQDSYFDTEDNTTPNQRGTHFTMFDTQMYVFDSYTAKTAFSKTKDGYSVTFLCNHAFLGTISYDQYWYYDSNNFDLAKKTYNSVNESVEQIMADFVDENRPTAIFWPFIRKAIAQIDPEGQLMTSNPMFNHAREYDHLMSPDWRENLYGTRYPGHKEVSRRQYYEGKDDGIMRRTGVHFD